MSSFVALGHRRAHPFFETLFVWERHDAARAQRCRSREPSWMLHEIRYGLRQEALVSCFAHGLSYRKFSEMVDDVVSKFPENRMQQIRDNWNMLGSVPIAVGGTCGSHSGWSATGCRDAGQNCWFKTNIAATIQAGLIISTETNNCPYPYRLCDIRASLRKPSFQVEERRILRSEVQSILVCLHVSRCT